MWKEAANDPSAESWKLVRKPLRIGSVATQASCHLFRCPKSHTRLNWMKCIPFYSRKKQSLHPNCGRPSQPLYSELGRCSYKNQWSTASMLGKSTSSQTVLQWRISCLWHTVLWSTLRNANGQERNLFGGSRQCRFATLLETFGSQIQMLFQKSRRFVQEHSLVCLLLQSEADYEKTISKIFLSPHWFLISSLLDTPWKIKLTEGQIVKL